MLEPVVIPGLPTDRFRVTYQIQGNEETARKQAEAICIEQTVEFPADLLPEGDIPAYIVGRIEAFGAVEDGVVEAVISYPTEITDLELTQFLNVLFGNTSIKPGIRVVSIELSRRLEEAFQGPRFGRAGLRELLGVYDRPLLCTAIKPMGMSAERLAEIVYQSALGGIDLVKDDHGLANQSFCPFEERAARCAEAVRRANAETGLNCLYLPNVSGPVDKVVGRARFAREAGAGGLLISPGLTGLDMIRLLASDDSIGLPIMSHPSFLGSHVTSPAQGIAHSVIFGQLMRMAGADAVVYPNYGGRFAFSQKECETIVDGTEVPMGHIKPIFPTPGGGMSLDRIPELSTVYGQDVIYLIGGDLHRGSDLVTTCHSFVELVSQGMRA